MTNVDEWTNDETGARAIIAIGNRTKNGNCAPFVKIIINININKLFISERIKFHLPNILEKEIIINNLLSPKRFKIIVIIPELTEPCTVGCKIDSMFFNFFSQEET